MRNPDGRGPDEYDGKRNAANGLNLERHPVIIGVRAPLSKLALFDFGT